VDDFLRFVFEESQAITRINGIAQGTPIGSGGQTGTAGIGEVFDFDVEADVAAKSPSVLRQWLQLRAKKIAVLFFTPIQLNEWHESGVDSIGLSRKWLPDKNLS
jgi:hypothetical protein